VCLKLLKRGYDVYSVDNSLRRNLVHQVKGDSGIPISDRVGRKNYIKDTYKPVYKDFHLDLTTTNVVLGILKFVKPDVILHLASQPSAPYSHIGINEAVFTQKNNTTMLMNILWGLKELEMNPHLVVTTTTGIYGQPDFDIPEGWLQPYEMKIPYPNMAGSFYHMSRGFDAGNLWLASKMFNFPITELRTSIIGGSSTIETRAHKDAYNRFDFDFYFGVVTNRFVAQALMGKPITIYGKGDQQRPIISLEDACESTVNSVELREGSTRDKYEIYNQTQGTISPVEIANTVRDTLSKGYGIPVEINNLPNPRVENEEAPMKMDNRRFVSELLPDGFQCELKEAIEQICHDTAPYRDRIKEIGKFYK
jgi:nucleoside-diphosphate-sugar epimerase